MIKRKKKMLDDISDIYFYSFIKGCPSACNTPKKVSSASNIASFVSQKASQSNKAISRGLFDESKCGEHIEKTPSAVSNTSLNDSKYQRLFDESEACCTPFVRPSPSRSQNSSRNSTSFRSMRSPNESRSLNDSSTIHDSSAHEKSRDRRNHTSTICLGDFLSPVTNKQQKNRKSTGHTSAENDKDKSRANRISFSSTPRCESTPKSKQQPRRVVPTPVRATHNDFTSPAFCSDNNLLAVSHDEPESTHQLLKMQKDEIKKVFQDERPSEKQLRAFVKERVIPKSATATESPPIDLDKVTHVTALDKFVEIYLIILDMNLVTNVLGELAFLLSLINTDTDDYIERNPRPLCTDGSEAKSKDLSLSQNVVNDAISLLSELNNCIYFSLKVLKRQQRVLRSLDTTSIKVLIDNKRLTALDESIRGDLMAVYALKIQLESAAHQQSSSTKHSGSAKVFYQQEQDTQSNFPSNQEFAVFKKQRDAFYSILR